MFFYTDVEVLIFNALTHCVKFLMHELMLF